jgi:LysM repeat protein
VGLPLNKPEFKDQDPLVLKNNRALLQRTLTCGRAGTRMPAWLNTNGGSLNARQVDHLINLITAPVDEKYKDENGDPTSKGWTEAVEFGENLNRETVVVVGGDTLGTIAKDHNAGLKEFMELNPGKDPDAVIKKGTKVQLPKAAGRPNGKTYEVKKDKETLRKINDGQLVGALIIADLNKIAYTVSEKTLTLKLSDGDKSRVAGLIPGVTLALPEGSQYILKAGDTVDAIAKQHGVSTSDIQDANKALLLTVDGKPVSKSSDALDAERKLNLPANPVAVVQAGQTAGVIASTHGLKPEDLGSAVPGEGQQLKLPAGTRYTVQAGDTLETVAKLHGITTDELAKLNGLKAGDSISPSIVLKLPKIEKYNVKGQSLDDIGKTFSNVTALSLGEAQNPQAPANAIYAIGTQLVLPKDAWGSAPPDTINNGSACVEHALPDAKLKEVLGTGAKAPEAPAAVSKTVLIESNANDWTVTADGTKQSPNKGAVSVAKGTKVTFKNVVGTHTITINGKDDEPSWKGTDQKDITFGDAGSFKITCTIHPAMLAYVFVQ